MSDAKTINTGIHAIDSQTKGYQPGTVSIFAGAAGGFRSTVMIDMAKRMADKGFSVLFVSFEMDVQTIYMKLLSRFSGVDYSKLTYLPVDTSEPWIQNLRESKKKISIVTASYRDEFQKFINYIKIKSILQPFDCLIIDSLDMIQAGIEPGEGVENPAKFSRSGIVRQLRILGHENNFATIATTSVSRSVYERAKKANPKFNLDDVRYTEFAHDVDNVFVLWRGSAIGEKPEQLSLFLHAVKLRYAESGRIRRLLVDPERCRIEEAHDAVTEKLVLDNILNG